MADFILKLTRPEAIADCDIQAESDTYSSFYVGAPPPATGIPSLLLRESTNLLLLHHFRYWVDSMTFQ